MKEETHNIKDYEFTSDGKLIKELPISNDDKLLVIGLIASFIKYSIKTAASLIDTDIGLLNYLNNSDETINNLSVSII